MRQLSNPIMMEGRRLVIRRPAPRLSEDAEDILRELGYGDEEIRKLGEDGVVLLMQRSD